MKNQNMGQTSMVKIVKFYMKDINAKMNRHPVIMDLAEISALLIYI